MKNINVDIPTIGKCAITTDHPSSSYNQPVLVREDGQAFGPGDIVQGHSVSDWVRSSSQWTGAADEPWDDETRSALIRFGVRDITYPLAPSSPNDFKDFFQS